MALLSVRLPAVGSLEWERLGGPPLSLSQRAQLLAGMAVVLGGDLAGRARWQLALWRLLGNPYPQKIDLTSWAQPDTSAVRQAREFLREVASPQILHHSYRCYYFTAALCELGLAAGDVDPESLSVAVLLHDVGLFDAKPAPGDHCFTVASAREARRIAAGAGWDAARVDAVALAITANLNPFVNAEVYGPLAHIFRHGGLVDVLAQEWKLHPDNLAEILRQHPRDGFADDTANRIKREVGCHPGCRFACYGALFPAMVKLRRFRIDSSR